METERISFEGEHWFEIKTVMTRGMRKEIDLAAQKSIDRTKAARDGVNLENPDELKAWLLRQPEYLASSIVDDAMLKVGTVKFSYGDKVTAEVLDEIPDEITSAVLARMRSLYYPVKQEEMADFFAKR